MNLPRQNQNSPIHFLHGLMLFASYWATAKLGVMLSSVNHHVSPVWPASGVAIAGLLVLGRRYWPFVFAGAVASNYALGTPIWAVFVMSIGNTVEAVIGDYCFRRFDTDKTKNEIPMIAGLSATVFSAVPIAALIGSLTLASTQWGSGPLFNLVNNIFTWWTGDTIGVLLVVPLLLRARAGDYTSRNWKKSLEAGAYFLSVAGLGYLTIWSTPDFTATIMFLFPLLLVGVWRLGAVETGLSLWIMVFVSVMATKRANGPFYSGDFNANLVQLQLFVGALAGTEIALRFFKFTRVSRSIVVTLLVSWFVTGLVFHSFNRKESEIDQGRFHKLVSDAQAKIAERLILHETVLRSGMGLLSSNQDEFDDRKWKRFVDDLGLQKITGLYGLGFTVAVPTAKLESWISARRKKAGEDIHYELFESKDMIRTPLPVDEHVIVIGFEPRRKYIGQPISIDVTLENNRYRALMDARESKGIRISDKVPIQGNTDASGYFLISPIFRANKFMGWVHSPVLMSRLLEDVFGKGEPEVAMIAEFVGNQVEQGVLYPSTLTQTDLNPRHQIQSMLPVWGKNFRMTWYRTNHFESRKDTTAAWIHFIGALISLLLTTLVQMYETQFTQARRLADQKTREVQMRDRLWTSLTRVVPAGIFQLDLNGKLTFTNEKWREYTKLDPATHPESCWISALDPSDHVAVRTLWEDLQNRRIESMQVQCRVPASNKTFAMSIKAVQDDTGELSHFIGTLHDITEIHARQMQIMHSSRMASIGVMAAGMAHEINNPLAIIAGRTQLMMRHLDHPGETPRKALKDSAAIIKQTVDRIARIVRGLRAFSRGGGTDSFIIASVGEIVQSTVEFCAERFKKGGVELRVKSVPQIELGCREIQVSQVLLNLINNGYDAVVGLEDKWVEIEVQDTPSEVIFSVTDSGSGIKPEVAEKIMIPFFTTKPIGQGTGLGLSISKGIAQDHSGDLILDTKSSRTRFVFSVSKRLLEDGTILAAL